MTGVSGFQRGRQRRLSKCTLNGIFPAALIVRMEPAIQKIRNAVDFTSAIYS